MKYLVDRLPETQKDCNNSEWKPYPPFIEAPGRYICKIDKKNCNLDEDHSGTCVSCRWLKTIDRSIDD